MTTIFIAAGFFAVGLLMVFLFRRAVGADDELERRWAEVVQGRREDGGAEAVDEPDGGPSHAAGTEPPGSGCR